MNKKKTNMYPLFYYLFIIIGIGALDHIYKTNSRVSFTNISFVLCPALWVVVTKFAEKAIDRYFSGRMAAVVKEVNISLRWGLALFLFVFLLPQGSNLYMTAYGILFFTLMRAMFILIELISHYIVVSAAIRAVLYLVQGVALKLVFENIWGGVWNIGIRISIGDMVLTAYLFLSACSLLSLLQLYENDYLARAGRWFEDGYFSKSLYVCALFFILKDVREQLDKELPSRLVVVEWFLIFLCLGIFIFILMKKIFRTNILPDHKDLKKHMLEVKFVKNNNMIAVSSYIDEFVETGNVSRILTYMAYLSRDLSLSTETATRLAVQPLLEYKEPPLPAFQLKRETDLLNEKNKQKRREILEIIIENMKQYGGHRNGYNTASRKM